MSDPRRSRRIAQIQNEINKKPPRRSTTQLTVPNIIEFVTSPQYLNRPMLYPRQALLLKIICLSVELLTPYDYEVLGDWERGFELVAHGDYQRFEGQEGLAPGTVARMLDCKRRGRETFREIVLVMGRRAGKGYLSTLVMLYQLWRILVLGNPQHELALEQTKDLLFLALAGDLSQANANQFRDIAGILQSAPCFAPYVGKRTRNNIRLRTPFELAADPTAAGSILIEARPATANAGRGAASLGFIFDEMSHSAEPGLVRAADEVYRGAAPSMAQFRYHACTVLASSPRSQVGEFFTRYLRGLDVVDGLPADPTMLVVHLPTWGTYQDWERTKVGLPMWPDGPNFQALDQPIVSREDLEHVALNDPDIFRVEHLARWRTSPSAYLQPDHVEAIFDWYDGSKLEQRVRGVPGRRYVMACDPSFVGANFAVAIGHSETDDEGVKHVVFDFLHVFRPRDFPNGEIHYPDIENELKVLITAFTPYITVFDQFESILIAQQLQLWANKTFRYGVSIQRNPASSQSNMREAELFKTLAAERRIHAPFHELARDELHFLQLNGTKVDHPTVGPCRTSDMADTMFAVVALLSTGEGEGGEQFGGLFPTGTMPGPGGGSLGGSPRRGEARGTRRRNPARGRRGRF